MVAAAAPAIPKWKAKTNKRSKNGMEVVAYLCYYNV